MDKHFTATTYVFNPSFTKTLFHWHNKLQAWLPAGGHIEKHETPYEAAQRELFEEYGLDDVEIKYKNFYSGNSELVIDERAAFIKMPFFIISEEISKDHFHLDCLFYTIIKEDQLRDGYNGLKFRWFKLNELLGEQEPIFENVRKLALRFKSVYESTYSIKSNEQ